MKQAFTIKQKYIAITMRFLLFFVPVYFTACTAYYPTFKQPVEKDVRGVETYNKPEYKEEPTTLSKLRKGIVVTGSLAAGAYAGYYIIPPDPTQNWYKGTNYSASTKRTLNAITFGVLSGITGLIIDGFIDYVFLSDTSNSVKPLFSDNTEKWLKEFDNDLIYISHEKNDNQVVKKMYAINKKAKDILPEKQFVLKNVFDVKLYKALFPNSLFTLDVVKSSLTNFSQEDLLILSGEFSNSIPIRNEIIAFYISNCKTIQCCSEIATKYPNYMNLSEEKALALCNNIDDMAIFKYYFPGVSLGSKVEERALDLANNVYGLKSAVMLYPSIKSMPESEEKAVILTKSFSDASICMDLFQSDKLKDKLEEKTFSYISSLEDVIQYQKIYPLGKLINQVEKKAATLVNDMPSAEKFARLFPKSQYAEQVVNQVFRNRVSRDDMPLLASLYPNLKTNQDIIKSYVTSANSFDDCVNAAKKYPQYKNLAAEQAEQFISSETYCALFLDEFPDAPNAKKIRQIAKSMAEERQESEREYQRSIAQANKQNSNYSSSCDKLLKDYERYVDSYIKVLKKAKNGDLSAMADYPDLLQKAQRIQVNLQGCQLDGQSQSRFLKIQQKLLSAAYSR